MENSKLDKQIEEMCAIMADDSYVVCEDTPLVPESAGICDKVTCHRCKEARRLISAGYRKASEVAEDIFAEIEKRLAMYSHIHRYAEEANKVTEEYADGSPVEMTSVWDACRLEHNGYDDYETMCKLQDNIGNIEKSRLLKEFEGDIAQLKKKYIGKDTNVTTNTEEGK